MKCKEECLVKLGSGTCLFVAQEMYGIYFLSVQQATTIIVQSGIV